MAVLSPLSIPASHYSGWFKIRTFLGLQGVPVNEMWLYNRIILEKLVFIHHIADRKLWSIQLQSIVNMGTLKIIDVGLPFYILGGVNFLHPNVGFNKPILFVNIAFYIVEETALNQL